MRCFTLTVTIRIKKLPVAGTSSAVDDERRLEALHALGILDTASQGRFDQYTELVTTLLDVPIALISLVDRHRQWFKSVKGLPIRQTHRKVSFCTHAIGEKDLLVIPDTHLDPRFASNPMVEGSPHVRFYAGAVIRGPSGDPLGTCCAMDRQPRTLSDRDSKSLLQIARMVEREIRADAAAVDDTSRQWTRGSFDATTGLPDLALFGATLHERLDTAGAKSLSKLLAVVRVERFDALEAAVGRQATKFLVGELANRLRRGMSRDCDIGQAREDKLCVLLSLEDSEAPESLLDAVLNSIGSSITLGDHIVPIRISVGASVFPRHATTAEKLMKRARTALWSSPLAARSSYNLYRKRQSDRASRDFRLQSAIRFGLDRGEFRLVYQPKVDIRRQSVVGVEALLRWDSATLGSVSPVEFIPVAERTGMIVELGEWVLNAACAQMAQWLKAGVPCPEIAVNIASVQLRRSDFIDSVQNALSSYDVAPHQLNLELTESSLVEDIEGVVKLMKRLKRLGITFSIDDFGTGFSSLSYLRRMPVSTLKIDRSFVRHILESADDMKLVRSIVSMGHDLGMKVIAEGAESAAHLERLRSVGCDQVQGFVFSRPLPAESLERYLGEPPSIVGEPDLASDPPIGVLRTVLP